jgi:hypothetical protein
VRAIIEVKTTITNMKMIKATLNKLAKNSKLCLNRTSDKVWTGLFTYNEANDKKSPPNHDEYSDRLHQKLLLAAYESHLSSANPAVDCISCGKHAFVKFWQDPQQSVNPHPDGSWYSYDLRDLAPSYFLGNLVDSLSTIDNTEAGFAWFPLAEGKNPHQRHYIGSHNSHERSF